MNKNISKVHDGKFICPNNMEILNKRYKVISHIGEASFCDVYKCERIKDGQIFIVKV